MPDRDAKKYRISLNAAVFTSVWASAVIAAVLSFGTGAGAQEPVGEKTPADNTPGMVIEPTELPTTYPRGPYQVIFHARGNFVPPLHWSLGSGTLPQGITLDDSGSPHRGT